MSTSIQPVTNGVMLSASLYEDYLHWQEEGIAIPSDAKEINLSNYTRLAEGDNRFRLVDRPIYGAEVWYRREKVDEETGEVLKRDDGEIIMETKVMRFKPGEPIISPAELRDWKRDKPRKFIGMLVYNYATGSVEILTASQKDLFESLFGILRHSADGMNPFKADFKVQKKHDGKKLIAGRMMDTYKYIVTQSRETNTADEVINALQCLPMRPNLPALYDGEDPFSEDFAVFEEVTPAQQLSEKAVAETKQSLEKTAA